MPRLAYVNGRYVLHRDALVHIDDRGYQFADGVYEVVPLIDGRIVDEDAHIDRLEYSLDQLSIPMPVSRAALRALTRELMRRNGIASGIVYMQATRGVAPRDHRFPNGVRPSLVMTTQRKSPLPQAQIEAGVAVVTMPDLRWRRCDIKATALLGNILSKQSAVEQGAFEGWLVDDSGDVTEGTSTNAWIATPDKRLVTRNLSNAILSGITRKRLIAVAAEKGFKLEERAFTVAEAQKAAEAFITSSTSLVLPVASIDGKPVGSGRSGPLALALRQAYLDFVLAAPPAL
ncbi:MAG: D-amino-acid transaminase [Dongiaceae bacterium]